MKTLIINAKDAVLGRLGSFTAKELLKGNSVMIINSEDVIISGRKDAVIEKIMQKRKMGAGGSLKGPRYIRQTDRLLKRMIRGMLPWDKPKGRAAYKRLKCYISNGGLKDEEIKNAINLKHKTPMKYFTLKEVSGGLKK